MAGGVRNTRLHAHTDRQVSKYFMLINTACIFVGPREREQARQALMYVSASKRVRL
jgi:hypothetical protein